MERGVRDRIVAIVRSVDWRSVDRSHDDPTPSEKGFAIQKAPPLRIPDDPRSYIIPHARQDRPASWNCPFQDFQDPANDSGYSDCRVDNLSLRLSASRTLLACSILLCKLDELTRTYFYFYRYFSFIKYFIIISIDFFS